MKVVKPKAGRFDLGVRPKVISGRPGTPSAKYLRFLKVPGGSLYAYGDPLICMRGQIIDASSKLATILEGLSHNDRDLVLRAREKVKRLYEGKVRLSGEPAFGHSENVALILGGLFRIRTGEIIAAGYLHDYIEDMVEQGSGSTGELYDELAQEFGDDVADLVLGVTKLSAEAAAAIGREPESTNLFRLIKHCARNIGVLVIKLADNLDNSEDQDPFPREKQIEHSKESLDYARLANSEGIWVAKRILEENASRYLGPEVYEALKAAVERSLDEKGDGILEPVITNLQDRFQHQGITAEIRSNPRNVSETLKLLADTNDIQKALEILQDDPDRIPDVLFEANRLIILVENETECFQALGALHSAFTHVRGKIVDYVSFPLSNGYQALLTDVTVPEKGILNVIIQTRDMHKRGEYGPIVEHHDNPNDPDWYKTGDRLADRLRGSLIEDGQDQESLRKELELIDTRVVVFTPRMGRVNLPKEASYLDFAFKVHSDMGMRASRARVRMPGENPIEVDILEEIKEGSIVTILPADEIKRRPSDVFRVKTKTAQEKIRSFINKLSNQERLLIGQKELEDILASFEVGTSDVFPPKTDIAIKIAVKFFENLRERCRSEFHIKFKGKKGRKKFDVVTLNDDLSLMLLLGSGRIDPREVSRIFAETYVAELLDEEAYKVKIRLLVNREVDPLEVVSRIRELVDKIVGALPEEQAKNIDKKKIINAEHKGIEDVDDNKKMITLEIELHDFLQVRQVRDILRHFGIIL